LSQNYRNLDQLDINHNNREAHRPSLEEYRESMLIKMATRISVFFILTFLTLSITFLNDDFSSLMGYVAALAISTLMLIHLHFVKNPKLVFALYGVFGSIISLASCSFILEATHYVDFIWIIVCTFVVYLGGHKKLGLVILIFNAIGIGYFLYFRHNIHISIIQESSVLQLTGAYLEIILSLFILAYLMYQFIHFQEYNDKQIKLVNSSLVTQNQVIEKQNSENIALIKEIHHRVKNNLQIIVSLLRLQKNELQTSESREQFQEAINRVLVMSSIHQKLYQQENLNNVKLKQYLDELIGELKILFDDKKQIDITVSSEIPHLELKTMVPVGLIINELVSNSLKYAFTNLERGSIKIDIALAEQGFNVKYSDNGKWLEEEGEHGFGLELVGIFTSQLNGTRTFVINTEGSNYLFELEFAD
jgi:two-component sensor histidine kinase